MCNYLFSLFSFGLLNDYSCYPPLFPAVHLWSFRTVRVDVNEDTILKRGA